MKKSPTLAIRRGAMFQDYSSDPQGSERFCFLILLNGDINDMPSINFRDEKSRLISTKLIKAACLLPF